MAVIDNDAVIINGNAGDFISGGHVPIDLNLDEKISPLDDFNWTFSLNKHYSLWGKLRTQFNDNLIALQLSKIAYERCVTKNDNRTMYSVMECMECIGRQSRLVSNQQRSYEFFGHEWRLPLWDEELLDFWEGVPMRYKIKQKLYKDVLHGNDWGGVWNTISINRKLIRPYSLWFFRLFMKIIIAPFSKEIWHRVEKNMFVYWMHPSYARAVTSYFSVLFDRRGQRNTNSWTADQFVNKKGLKDVVNVSEIVKNKHNGSR
jgi:asparagine synthase (glutamine-hydrolysing)